ncbi:right-handed parallel beta-helix repeat-containing protein [Caryophanon latum]|nr:right-handed parallel beta-helix repeat-containing protein [Caryophanon latum]
MRTYIAMIVVLLSFVLPMHTYAANDHEDHHTTEEFTPIERDPNEKSELQELIDATPANGVLKLEDRTYRGSMSITRPITIEGTDDTAVKSLNVVFTIENTENVTLRNLHLEANVLALYASKINNLTLENVTIASSPAAIHINKSQNVSLNNLDIIGMEGHFAKKENAVALFDVNKATLTNMSIQNMLDAIYVERVQHLTAHDNVVSGNRYGFHVMYSDYISFSNNTITNNMTGLMIMIAKDVQLRENMIEQHNDLNSIGTYLYDVEDVAFKNNTVRENTMAFDLQNARNTVISDNVFSTNGTVLQLKKSGTADVHSNMFYANILTARADAESFALRKNSYDDFSGYDFDEDGYGDTPYIASNAFGQWMVQKPVYQYYMGSPAVTVLNTIETAVTGNAKSLIIDEHPQIIQNEVALTWQPQWVLFGTLLTTLAGLFWTIRRWFM